MTTPFSQEFRLSITKALGDQLAEALRTLTPTPLSAGALAKVARRSGVYQLFLDGELVYVGKAEASIPNRLGQHLRKISGRRHIDLSRMSFTCLYVSEDFSAVAPEKLLIKRIRAERLMPWNTNGFGNKDPGRNRDNTVLKSNHFDVQYPIDLDLEIIRSHSGPMVVGDLLQRLKEELPYNFRYKSPPNAVQSREVKVPFAKASASACFQALSAELPDSWQISALMGYVIMYDDGGVDYPSGWRYYRSGRVISVAPRFEPAGDMGELE